MVNFDWCIDKSDQNKSRKAMMVSYKSFVLSSYALRSNLIFTHA